MNSIITSRNSYGPPGLFWQACISHPTSSVPFIVKASHLLWLWRRA